MTSISCSFDSYSIPYTEAIRSLFINNDIDAYIAKHTTLESLPNYLKTKEQQSEAAVALITASGSPWQQTNIIWAFEFNRPVYGIVLATRGGIVDTKSGRLKERPRLNTIDEAKRLRAKFPNRTILLLEKGVKLSSNISGLTHESFTRQSMDRAFTAIARELREMGILKMEKPPFKERHLAHQTI